MKKYTNPALKIMTVNVGKRTIAFMDYLVSQGYSASRSEYIRHACNQQIIRDFIADKAIHEVAPINEDTIPEIKVENLGIDHLGRPWVRMEELI